MTKRQVWIAAVLAPVIATAAAVGAGRALSAFQSSQAPTPAQADDHARMKTIVGLIHQKYTSIPLDKSGAVDVYRLAHDGHLTLEEAEQVFWSDRATRGPTRDDIVAGDYAAFPYRRLHRRFVHDEVPVIWDPEPTGRTRLRLAGFLDGSVREFEADVWADLVARRGPFDE